MWTPRRILLLLLGLAGSTAAYVGYAQILGGVDGLPDLPAAFLTADDNADYIPPPADSDSPTILRLKEAFGPTSWEVVDSIAYKTKIEERDKGLVFACGLPAFSPEPSKFVTVSPFSLANFGKPKAGPRKPGEVPEISTFHADRAVLEFDKDVSSPQDLTNGKAKLVGIELVSTPDLPSPDIRKGRVWITNNQKSADPAEYIVFSTPGPLFYRTPEATSTPGAPNIWTAAAVEVIDRRNLPRKLRSDPLVAVPSRTDDLRGRNAVENILLGLTAPPPTITAEGMKIYLRREDEKAGDAKRNGTGYTGVDAIVLEQKVQFNTWSDGGAGFPGSAGSDAKPAGDPPAAAAAVLGGLSDAAPVANRVEGKRLLVIDTLGPFRYDLRASTARFDAAASANPAVPNHVTVSRLSARGSEDNLFCKTLVVEFADPAANKPPPAAKPQPAGPAGGMKIKALTATGEHVFVSVEGEQLLAQGTELRYETAPTGTASTTILKGAPVIAVRERNQLQGGDAATPAEIRIATTEPPPGSREKKHSAVAVIGPGRIKMFDQAANDTTLSASWGTSLTQERVAVGGKDQDLFKFEGGGAFADTKGDMKLTADRLWLWLGAGDESGPTTVGKSPTSAKPQRLVATGRVTSVSPELMIRNTDQLTVWFRDVPAPPADPTRVAAKAALPEPPPKRTTAPVLQQVSATDTEPKAPPKPAAAEPKIPLFLTARVIESWVVRHPQPAAEKQPAKSAAAGPGQEGLKYELERARCEDRVQVHQPPKDPNKATRGVDIFGARLNLDQSPAGGVLTVYGAPDGRAEVYFEDLQLFGPVVKIDQPQNTVAVDGKGWLLMPGGSDLSGDGKPAGRPVDMKIDWSQEMRFNGAMQTANFLGRVQAVQQPRPSDTVRARPEKAPLPRHGGTAVLASRTPAAAPPEPEDAITRSVLACHRLDVTFDRPIYFNQAARDRDSGGKDGKAKLRTALCTPMPDDEARAVQKPDLLVSDVYFFEDAIGPGGKVVRANRIRAKQLDVHVEDRVRQMYATGIGEVRILQKGAKDGVDPAAAPADGNPDDHEMKLTLVNFKSRLSAKETRFGDGFFQEATFDSGAAVIQVPTENLNLAVAEHNLPPRSVVLDCTESLKVSTKRTKKAAAPEQRMTADGNARFMTDEYEGIAARIEHQDGATTLHGDRNGPARLQRRRRLGLNEQDFYSGERIVHNKDGSVRADGTIDGAITPGP